MPDCAEAWFYGWETVNKHDFERDGMGFHVTMTAIRPHWRYVTLTATVRP